MYILKKYRKWNKSFYLLLLFQKMVANKIIIKSLSSILLKNRYINILNFRPILETFVINIIANLLQNMKIIFESKDILIILPFNIQKLYNKILKIY